MSLYKIEFTQIATKTVSKYKRNPIRAIQEARQAA